MKMPNFTAPPILDQDPIESDHDLISLSEHDLRANASAFVARENRFPLFRIMLYSANGPPRVSRAASAAASVMSASTIIMIDTPVVPPKYPAIAVAMIGEKPPPIAADIWKPK